MSLSDQELRKILENLSSDDLEADKAFIGCIKYEGFDATNFRRETLKTASLKDVSMLCTLIAVRGTNARKAMEKMSAKGKTAVTNLMASANLTSSRANRGTALAPKARTLGRLAAAFPDLMAKAMVSFTSRLTFEVPEQYSFICSPSAASVIPRDWEDLINMQWE